MRIESPAHLLRIFINESDRWEGRALYETLVRVAREQGMAGANALRAIEGFGAGGRVHSVKIAHLSEDVPIVVEIIDRPERVAAFLALTEKMIAEGLVTVEKIHTFTYRRDAAAEATPQFEEDEIQLDTGEGEPPIEESPAFADSNDRAREALEAAQKSATSSRRVFVDSIDVLLALMCESNGIAAKALANLGLDCRHLQRTLRETVSRDEPSPEFLKSVEAKSVAAAKWLGHKAVGTEHLLIALCQIRPNAASDVLMRMGTQPRDICKEVLAILDHTDDWQAWLADHPEM